MKNIKFNSFYYGTPVLFRNIGIDKEVVINELLGAENGEWSFGGYRFILID